MSPSLPSATHFPVLFCLLSGLVMSRTLTSPQALRGSNLTCLLQGAAAKPNAPGALCSHVSLERCLGGLADEGSHENLGRP